MIYMSKKNEDKVTNGGSMTTRQVLLLGGTALVLAACADFTAPETQMRRAGQEGLAKKSDTTAVLTSEPTTSDTSLETCRGGFVIVAGRDEPVCVDELEY
jgi:hypothetical protein